MMNKRIMILGAGVIGSIYAIKFANAGYDITLVARSNRLNQLEKKAYYTKKIMKFVKLM